MKNRHQSYRARGDRYNASSGPGYREPDDRETLPTRREPSREWDDSALHERNREEYERSDAPGSYAASQYPNLGREQQSSREFGSQGEDSFDRDGRGDRYGRGLRYDANEMNYGIVTSAAKGASTASSSAAKTGKPAKANAPSATLGTATRPRTRRRLPTPARGARRTPRKGRGPRATTVGRNPATPSAARASPVRGPRATVARTSASRTKSVMPWKRRPKSTRARSKSTSRVAKSRSRERLRSAT